MGSHGGPLLRSCKSINAESTGKKRDVKKILCDSVLLVCVALIALFCMEWWIISRLPGPSIAVESTEFSSVQWKGHMGKSLRSKQASIAMHERLLALAAHALAEAEGKKEPEDVWNGPIAQASQWKPCSDQQVLSPPALFPKETSGYILVSANGGLNQQRVAVCNAVAVARLLNATLVIPKFLVSNVWNDNSSQFADIYDIDFFIDYLQKDLPIVKELPVELQSLNLDAIGSLVTDMEVPKESKPSYFLTNILPILLRNRVVHFLGFGNRLSFDPIPFEVQRLRCRCNFHALRFVPKLQSMGNILVRRMRSKSLGLGPAENELFSAAGSHALIEKMSSQIGKHLELENLSTGANSKELYTEQNQSSVKFLALHLRFETDMVAYSMCDFGGGEAEREELQAYRKIHFPLLAQLEQDGKLQPAATLRELGRCPLTPEETVLMLSALGLKRGTRIFLAGAHIYGGQARMVALINLFPNVITKEDLLLSEEMAVFANHSSQLAALDFIVCKEADIFAMTDSGSQLSSLVGGHRMYFGGGHLPTIRPNKRRLASIFSNSFRIEWQDFEQRVRKTIQESNQVDVRPVARSIYRHPRCHECMCNDIH
ncbi:hypothetical protein O6H91_Y026500 [Diphasiastrum complanatum]|nr:hypothetical protein O6H91_Y026500 [Diphasiastrum complanatum]